MRKYGIVNFIFEVLEETSITCLTDREQYWITYYNSLVPNGYNQEPATDAKRGENSNFAILTNEQANQIIKLLQETNIPMKDIASMFNVSGGCVEDINKGKNRVQQGLDYPIRKNAKSIGHTGESCAFSVLSTEAVMDIRQRYVNETLDQIYLDYQHLIGYAGLKKICYGATWKHLPVYKKREKKWVSYI